MKKIFVTFLFAVAALAGRAALPQPDLVAEIHFAGGVSIAADKHYPAFANEFSSPEAQALRQQTADKLARFFFRWFNQTSGSPVANGAAGLRPLLDELQNNEWYLEARKVGGKVETALAVKTSDAGAPAWRAGLQPFFPAATFARGHGWLIFRTSEQAPNITDKIPALNGAWLTLDLNWPTLGDFFPSVRELGLPETRFSVVSDATDLKIDGRFLFSGAISAPLDAWRVPTNVLHQPFVSFTAVRGISAWLDSQSWAAEFRLNPTPNQLYFWALPQMPFQSFAAIPCADSLAALQQMYANLQSNLTAVKSQSPMQFPFNLELTNRLINVTGMPFVAPYFEAVKGSAGQYLLAAGFPYPPRGKALPPELLASLDQKNLLFYHWEITAERASTLLQFSQFALMISGHKQLGENSAALKWLLKITPTLGNSATEITQTADDQMTFTRSAPGGFTAVELFALANWLEADNFPGCDLSLSVRTPRMKHAHPQSSVPAPVPGH